MDYQHGKSKASWLDSWRSHTCNCQPQSLERRRDGDFHLVPLHSRVARMEDSVLGKWWGLTVSSSQWCHSKCSVFAQVNQHNSKHKEMDLIDLHYKLLKTFQKLRHGMKNLKQRLSTAQTTTCFPDPLSQY